MTNLLSRQNSPQDEDEIDIGALIGRLWAGRYWIALFASFAGLIGLLIAMGTAHTYKADALLQLEMKSGQLALPAALTELTNTERRSATEIEILRSRLVLGQAVADARLDWSVSANRLPMVLAAVDALGIPLSDLPFLRPYVRQGEHLRLDLLEVPINWIAQDIAVSVHEGNRFSLLLPDGSTRDGEVDVTVSDSAIGFALRIGSLNAAAGREFTIRHLRENVAVRNLRGRLSVAERGRQSDILELSLTGQDPSEIARTLDAITKAYLRQNIARSAAEAESSLAFVESQLPAAEARTQAAERALNSYRQEQQAIDLSFEGQSLLTQIGALEDELQKLAVEEETLASRYTPNHPAYQQLLSAKERLELRLGRVREEVASLPQTQRDVLNLTRDLELAQAVYLELQNRAQELQVLRASSIGNVRIVDQATADERPIAPRRSRILALSVLLGIFAGIAFVLVQKALRKGVQSADEIARLDVPVYATINLSKQESGPARRAANLSILALSKPTDLTVEGFRSLRTSLHFAMLDASSRSVTLTSAAPEAGKSFCSVNLGVVAAQSGQKVCLVDADLRKGTLRRYFNVEKSHLGLADFLAGKAELDDVLVSGPIPGLYLIPSGVYPPNPSELLMRNRLAELVTALHSRFDLSVFDTPPALAVTDPIIVAQATGAAIAVIRFDETREAEIIAMQMQLQQGGTKLSGAILNGYDPRRAHYGYYYDYSYRYEYRNSDK